MYGFIPLLGADFLARVMPKFLNNVALAVASIASAFGKQVGFADYHILSDDWLMRLQYILVAIGAAGSLYAFSRIFNKDLKPLAGHSTLARLIPFAMVLLVTAGVISLFFFIKAAE
jgi:hypothetical protein